MVNKTEARLSLELTRELTRYFTVLCFFDGGQSTVVSLVREITETLRVNWLAYEASAAQLSGKKSLVGCAGVCNTCFERPRFRVFRRT